jgi:hypothetical protein
MKYYFSIFFFHFYFLFYGQITYTKIPLDLQLVARDKVTNLGNVIIEGNVDLNSSYSAIRVEVYRNDVLIDTEDNTLVYNDFKASFVFNVSIPSELANYSFKIYGYNSFSDVYELNKTVSNIVAGDTYIIQGQSNAVASKRNGSANGNKSDFIRVYSSGTPNIDFLLANDAWYIADGDGGSTSSGNAGQWGLKLARLLVDNLGIPIAIFNGAHNGQGISFFKAPLDYKTSQNSNYGRLYYRLKKTELENNVRAVLWSQGEANSGGNYISIQNYKSNFKLIENSYLKDYPNIEKFYIFQIKDMVCVDKTYEGKMNVKEAQRQLASENDEIDVISTTSLLLSGDSCHFPFENGYESFANRLYKLVLQDLYGKSFIEEIKSPMIKNGEFAAPNNLVLETDAIELKFSSTDQATMLNRLKKDFELKNAQNTIITSVNLSGNKIIFSLSGNPGPIANISFVGYNSNIGYTITNSSNLELICFRNFPIKNFSYSGGDNSNYPIIENTSICNSLGSITNIAVFSPNTNASYKWLYKIPNGDWTEITNLNAGTVYSNYNTAILEIKKSTTLPDAGTLFRVVANYGTLGNFTSNEALLTVDVAPVSKLITGASTLCSGASKTLTYGSDSSGTIQWQYSTSSSLYDFIDIYEENGLTHDINNIQESTWFRVMNSNGVCPAVYSPAVQIVVNPKPVAGTITGGNVNVCKTSNSTALKLNNSVGNIQWQKASDVGGLPGTFSNITSANLTDYTASSLTTTTYFRAALSSGVCTTEATSPSIVIVDPIAVSKTITGTSTLCAGGDETLTYGKGSVGTIQWQYSNTSSIADFIDINGENGLTYTANNLQQTTWFRVMNTSGKCSPVYSAPFQVMVNSNITPTFNQVAAICSGSSLTALPTTSINGIIGKWSPALNNTSTTTYTFTPTSGGCVNTTKMTIVVNQKEIPTFTPVESICSGTALPALPTTSTNGIIGTWSPALSNTVTKTYTFTPTNAVCTSNAAMTVIINTTLPPSGNAIQFFNASNPIYIKDLIVEGTDIRWYSSNENALTNTNPLEPLAVVTLGNTYYAMQSLNGCVSISPLAVTVSTSLENADIDFKRLYFYPNPIKNYFKLIYFEVITSIQLINPMGQSVFITHPNALEATLNINHLPSGIYFMELRSKDKKGIIKVIKS